MQMPKWVLRRGVGVLLTLGVCGPMACQKSNETPVDRARALYPYFERLKGDFSSDAVGDEQIDMHIQEAKFAYDDFVEKAGANQLTDSWAVDLRNAIKAIGEYQNQRKLMQVQRAAVGHDAESLRMSYKVAVNKLIDSIDRVKADLDQDVR